MSQDSKSSIKIGLLCGLALIMLSGFWPYRADDAAAREIVYTLMAAGALITFVFAVAMLVRRE